ncbi:RcnB family protein [uncultured Pseudomonas sp.]|jgi:Ni/Co efflux regulator RcnB|uniref:RcnB family protein n=1 Tax=Pseudomonas leptonychotis TaxID=2448482 RepID=UPI00261F0225|nr:RcnB family protein [uncultured Pseudomonas sp.]
MKKTLSVICAALMFSAPLASFAHPGTPQDHQHQSNQQKYNGPDKKQSYRDPGFRPQPGMPVPHSQWKRGHVVAKTYRADRYWVTDWRSRHLPAPPKNHRWLRINGDYVLVVVGTGVIINILTGY